MKPHTHTQTHTHTPMRTQPPPPTQTRKHTNKQPQKHGSPHAQTHPQATHPHTYTHTHTHTHTQTHTRPPCNSLRLGSAGTAHQAVVRRPAHMVRVLPMHPQGSTHGVALFEVLTATSYATQRNFILSSLCVCLPFPACTVGICGFCFVLVPVLLMCCARFVLICAHRHIDVNCGSCLPRPYSRVACVTAMLGACGSESGISCSSAVYIAARRCAFFEAFAIARAALSAHADVTCV